MKSFVGSTQPESISFVPGSGWDIESTKATTYGMTLETADVEDDVDDTFWEAFEDELWDKTVVFNNNAAHIEVSLLTPTGISNAFSEDIRYDLKFL